jgi:hypothetical protein
MADNETLAEFLQWVNWPALAAAMPKINDPQMAALIQRINDSPLFELVRDISSSPAMKLADVAFKAEAVRNAAFPFPDHIAAFARAAFPLPEHIEAFAKYAKPFEPQSPIDYSESLLSLQTRDSSELEEMVRRVLREELERATRGEEATGEPAYGSDGEKRAPGFDVERQ